MPENKLLSLKDELATGLHPGRHFQKAPLWYTGSNVKFTEDGPRKMQGWVNPMSSGWGAIPVRGLTQTFDGTLQKIYFADTTKIRTWDAVNGSQEIVVGNFSGQVDETVISKATTWSLLPYGTWVLATNGVDLPHIDKGAGMVPLDVQSQFTRAEIFIARGPHILALNTSVNARGFLWSDTDNPESWTPTTANAAGDLVFREASSDIRAAVPLGQNILAYTDEETFIISYVGGTDVFGYRPAATGIGAISKNSVVSRDRQNYGWGRQGLYVTDGISFQLIDADVREFLKKDVNYSQASKINGLHDEDNECIVWYYPSDGSSEPDKGICYHYQLGVWSTLDHGRTASIERNIFDYPITAASDGKVYFENYGSDADGEILNASIRTKPLDGGTPDYYKEPDALRVGTLGTIGVDTEEPLGTIWGDIWDKYIWQYNIFKQLGIRATGLKFKFGCQENEDDPITWSEPQSVLPGYNFSNDRLSGRYISLEFFSDALGDSWDIPSVDVYGVAGGTR